MSYDINLVDEKGMICTVENYQEGGTYVLGGVNRASLNITYNYAPFFYKFLDNEKGIRWLYGKKGEECVTRLERAIKLLGTKRSVNY